MRKEVFKKKIQNIKDSLDVDDIISLVCKGLGSGDAKWDAGGNPIFQTIDHNLPGEGSYKLYYYPSSKTFYSYTGDGAMDVFELVQKAKNYASFYEAYLFVCKFFNLTADHEVRGFTRTEETELTDDWMILNKYAALKTESVSLDEVHYNILNQNLLEYYYKAYPAEWIEQGITIEAMERFGIRVDAAGKKIIIPHYDIDGQLVGIRGRSYDEWDLDKGMKYAPVWIEQDCYRHELGAHLYGLDKNKETIKRLKKVCIFEAEKSVLLCDGYFPGNNYALATCGSSPLSKTQIDLLLSLGVNSVTIAYDKENDDDLASEQTLAYKKKLLRITQPLTPYFDVYVVFDTDKVLKAKDAPCDLGKDTLVTLLKGKQRVVSYSEADFEKGLQKRGKVQL